MSKHTIGYGLFFRSIPPLGHWCIKCAMKFATFSELYSHEELWHNNPIIKTKNLVGMTTVGDDSPKTKGSKKGDSNV